MRLLLILFYAIMGYIFWRIIRVGMRMMQGSRQDRDGHVYAPHSEPSVPSKEFRSGEIQDAKFEDILPSQNEAKGAEKKDS